MFELRSSSRSDYTNVVEMPFITVIVTVAVC